ncbi:hypothetical protein O6H91_10G082600 [Diphasiastrum complanatum]|uniref:Uncharacterized protein n=1 Tax=Diphasiastrum complanatum TaxID=34168 RepID=A0ACC2CIT3_DIPCM|nr:hypothetical protein O6H91_10G082600 [Diphasiastrum complanatum]
MVLLIYVESKPSFPELVATGVFHLLLVWCLFLVRTAYDAVTTNLVVYLTEKLHINNSKAASDVNSWLASSSVFSLFGAIVADSYSGRCLTSLVSILVHMIGMAILVIATALPSLKPHKCTGSCAETTGIRKAVFYLGLYITALGCGSFFPCFIAFGADQYDEGHPIEINKKSRYFSVSYLAVSCGGILGNTIIIYIEQNVSFTLGYGMSIGVLAIALLLNLAGTRFYRFQKPKGNPLTRIVQVWVAAAQKWGIKVSAPDKQLYEAPVDNKTGTPKLLHTEQFRFLDKAAIVTNSAEEVDESKRNPWKLCTVTQVEEAKFLLQIAPIWLSIVIYSMVDAQMWSVFVEQAATMDNLLNNFTVPPASMSIFNILSVCICIFAYEIIIVPIARRFTRHPRGLTTLQRTGVGLILGMFSMLSAALVEINRLRIAKAYALHHNPTATVPLSVFWLAPQYFLGGASEAFVESGQFEFFYSQAPESIRGIATSLHFAAYAMGCYMSGILITVVTSITSHGDNSGWISDNLNVNSRLDYFFGVMILIGALNFAGYLIFTYRYKYKNPVNEVGKIS